MAGKTATATMICALLSLSGGAVAAELEVAVRTVAHDQGAVKVALYAGAETFRKEDRAVAVQSLPAKPGEMTFVFPGIAEGRYAVIVYHDENGNGALDRFLGMVPTEGYGLSNNPEVSGPPAFDPSAFDVGNGQPVRTAVDLRY